MKRALPASLTVARRPSHGERTRHEILSVAVSLAAMEGLEGVSLSRLAEALKMSKAGVFAHFGSKEALQLATVAAAAEAFQAEIVAPAMAVAPGVERLRAMIDAYFAYLERRRDRGGCFFTATSFEMDDRPGEVRDRLVEVVELRRAFIEHALLEAINLRQLPSKTDVPQLAFEVTALLTGANLEWQLLKTSSSLERARRALTRWLDQLTPSRARAKR